MKRRTPQFGEIKGAQDRGKKQWGYLGLVGLADTDNLVILLKLLLKITLVKYCYMFYDNKNNNKINILSLYLLQWGCGVAPSSIFISQYEM